MDKLKKVLSSYLNEKETNAVILSIQNGLPVLVCGKNGPTGKTTLCKQLKSLGVDATEGWKAKKESDNNSVKIVITLDKKII